MDFEQLADKYPDWVKLLLILFAGGIAILLLFFKNPTKETKAEATGGTKPSSEYQPSDETPFQRSLPITFRDGQVAAVDFSVSFNVNSENAPIVIANFGNWENAKKQFQNILEGTVLGTLEKRELSDVRQSREAIRDEILQSLQEEGNKMFMTVLDFRILELKQLDKARLP